MVESVGLISFEDGSIDRLLASEEECAAYIFRLKWPRGFVCPDCFHTHAYTISTRRLPLYECAACKRQTSLIAGTVMEGTRTPLTKWFTAIRLISDRKQGISALKLQDMLSVTYKTAWSMLHKLRCAIAQEQCHKPLYGEVIIHDASYGRPKCASMLGPYPQEKLLLAGASVSEDEGVSQVALHMVDSSKHVRQGNLLSSAVTEFRSEHEIESSQVSSCQLKRYTPRKNKRLMPFVTEACQWLTGTFRGIGRKHLQNYLHEFCCRVNLELAGRSVFEGISRLCAPAVAF